MSRKSRLTLDLSLHVSCHGVRSGGGGATVGDTPKSPKTFAPSLCTLRESQTMPLQKHLQRATKKLLYLKQNQYKTDGIKRKV